MASRQTANSASSSGFQYAGNSAPVVNQLDILLFPEQGNNCNNAQKTGAGVQAVASPTIPIQPVSTAVATPSSVYGSSGASVGNNGLTESGTTVTVLTGAPIPPWVTTSTTVTIAGAGVSGYNGSFTVTGLSAANPYYFTYTAGGSGFANSGGGTAVFSGTTATTGVPALKGYVPAVVGTTINGLVTGPLEFWGDQAIWDTTNSRYVVQGINWDAAWQDTSS